MWRPRPPDALVEAPHGLWPNAQVTESELAGKDLLNNVSGFWGSSTAGSLVEESKESAEVKEPKEGSILHSFAVSLEAALRETHGPRATGLLVAWPDQVPPSRALGNL